MNNTLDNDIKNMTPAAMPQSVPLQKTMDDIPSRGMNLFFLLIITMAMIPWLFGDYEILGFKITGWSWIIPMILSALVFLGNIRRVVFPVSIWLPWIFTLFVYWFFGRYNIAATQSFMQMLSPLMVGCAASIFRPGNLQIDKIMAWITNIIWLALILLIIRMPILLSGQLPMYGFMGPSMIGFLLFGACYSAFYACGRGRYLFYYLVTVAMAVISHGRGPILAMLSCLPITLAPLKTKKG